MSWAVTGGGYAIALRSIRRQIETLRRDEETRYLGAMAHLDSLDDAITDITKGQKREKRRSRKKRKMERQATTREGIFRGGGIQADECSKGENEASGARDRSISHDGQAGHEQAIDRITTPPPLNAETLHPPDSNPMAETQDDLDRTLSDGSTLAGVASDTLIDTHTPRSSSKRQGLMRTESGNHIVPGLNMRTQ